MVRELEFIGEAEQADRSTTVRRLLASVVRDWKLKHYVRQYGEGKLTLARAAGDPEGVKRYVQAAQPSSGHEIP